MNQPEKPAETPASEDARHALIVEDDEGMREALCAVLSDEGYAPTAVATVSEARAELARESPAVILLDLELEDVESGDDLLSELDGDPAAPPTLVVSGALDAHQTARAYGVRHVGKPSGVDRVGEEVARTIAEERRPQRRPSRTVPTTRRRDSHA